MSTNHKATITKRQRELDQKDRVKMREARRAARRQRAADRAASGQVGPEIGEPLPPLGDIEVDDTPRQIRRHPAAGTSGEPSRDREQNMSTRLYVGNLSYDTTGEAIRAMFAEHGEVTDVHMVMDRDTGRPRGFAFVTMTSPADAEKAIRETDGRAVDGRSLRVNQAEERPRGGGGGGGGGGRRRF